MNDRYAVRILLAIGAIAVVLAPRGWTPATTGSARGSRLCKTGETPPRRSANRDPRSRMGA